MRRRLFSALIFIGLFALTASPAYAQGWGSSGDDASDESDDTADDGGDDSGGSWGTTDEDEAADTDEDEATDTDEDDDDASADEGDDDPSADEGDDDASPTALKREGQEAKKARKAAMSALSQRHPGRDDGKGFTPVVPTAPPIVREASETLPRLEHHGYFRARFDLFGNLDLDTRGTSPIAPPLDSDARGDDTQLNVEPSDSDTLAGGNIRMRYAPRLHITEDLRIVSTFDFLDNYVLGSTPAGMRGNRPDIPILGLTDSTESPSVDNIGRDALEVRALYGEAETIVGTIRAGRMPSDWGLGILANGGGTHSKVRQILSEDAWDCIDCNYGDYVDRLELITQIPFVDFFHLQFSWDFVSEGLVGYGGQTAAYGQAFDLAQADDVVQFVLAVFDRPFDRQSAEERRKAFDAREPVFDWGVYFVYREQDADLESPVDTAALDGNASFAQLEFRGLTTYIPDAFAQFALKFGNKSHVRIAAEVAAVIGTIESVDVGDTVERDLLQFGGAFESEVRLDDLYFGLNAGFASGGEVKGFGYQDVPVTGDPNAVEVANELNSFRFDRNYFVDQIMFREIVGGITNAVYFDLWGEYQFPVGSEDAPNIFGGRLDLITAAAPNAEATPGNANWYGFEADAKAYYKETDQFLIEAIVGVFIPGDVFTRRAGRNYPILPDPAVYPDDITVDNDITPGVAWTLQSNFVWLF